MAVCYVRRVHTSIIQGALDTDRRQIILKTAADVGLMSRAPSLYFYLRSSTALKIDSDPHTTSVSDQLLACKAGSVEFL